MYQGLAIVHSHTKTQACVVVTSLLTRLITRQMLGASWGEPECIFEVNNRFIGTYMV